MRKGKEKDKLLTKRGDFEKKKVVRWSEDAGTETRGSEGKDKRGGASILSANWGETQANCAF